jgi:hypothetical protein
MLFFYSKLLIQLYWITYYVGPLAGGLYHNSHRLVSSCAYCHCDLSSNGRGDTLSPIAIMIHQNPEANDKNNYRIIPQKSVPKAKHIYTIIIHQKSVPKVKHIYNHYPSYIVQPPYIKSKYQKASYICKFIHHTMFMITIHCLSTIHQKSVVHPPYNKFMILTNHSWLHIKQPRKMDILFDQVGGDISSLMKPSMWKSKPFLCSYKELRQMGHFNQRLTLGNLMGLTELLSSLLPGGKACWSSSSSMSSLAASFSAASFLQKVSSLLFKDLLQLKSLSTWFCNCLTLSSNM